MFFETLPGPDGNTQRATYRIEGAPAPPEAERGALVHIEQSAILEGIRSLGFACALERTT